MNLIHTVILVLLSVAGFTANAATFSTFPDMNQCELVAGQGKAAGYVPVTKSPFKGGDGWEQKTVGEKGACLQNPYVLEDGTAKKVAAVWVAPGFKYWSQKKSGALRMDFCSNPFDSIKEVEIKVAAAPAQPSASAPAAGLVQVASTAGMNSFKEIKLGEVMCIVHLHGGQYTNGQPIAVTFRPSKAECDEWELEVRARFVKSSVNEGVVTYDSTASTNVVAQQAVTPNWCVRAGKRYDCGANLPVILTGGAVKCLPQGKTLEPGSELCTGIQ